MNVAEESDRLIVSESAANVAAATELRERRSRAKENMIQPVVTFDSERSCRDTDLDHVASRTVGGWLTIQGGSRMRESRTYGSVRGVPRERHPYRNSVLRCGTRVRLNGVDYLWGKDPP